MDFGALPPEINSARMYAGPGSGPMLAAATAWGELAAGLRSTAAGYQSVLSELTSGPWQGAASVSMTTAAAPHVAWLYATAAQAEQAAMQAGAAASAYAAAHAMTVPPPMVAANRTQLISLVATNVLGQNTAAIAATEAHYGQMWAQDAAAMYGYAGASAAASKVTPFTPPPTATDPSGLVHQGVAAARSGASAGVQGTEIMSTGSRLMSSIPPALQGLSSPASASSPVLASPLAAARPLLDILSGHARTATSTMTFIVGATALARTTGLAGTGVQTVTGRSGGASVPTVTSAGGATGSSGLSALGIGDGAAVSAHAGRATPVGALSVPQSWAGSAPSTMSPGVAALPQVGSNATPATGLAGVPMMMPIGGLRGRGAGHPADGSRVLQSPRIVPRHPAGG